MTFAVMSSPTVPFPRVAAVESLPSLYRRDIETPSTFGSTTYVKPDTLFLRNSSNS